MSAFERLKLSPHFTLGEFACNGKTCGCGGAFRANEGLIALLESVREDIIHGPIQVTCGYRCPQHNREVGGWKNSYHCSGLAADITAPAIRESLTRMQEIAFAIGENLHAFATHGNVIYYPGRGFIHIDVGPPSGSPVVRMKGGG